MPCFQYLQKKEDAALDILGYIAKKQEEISTEILVQLSHLYGYSFSIEQLEGAKKNNDKYCEDILTTNETSNAICKVCKLSCNYMQENITQEETLLNHCIQKRDILNTTAASFSPDTLSLQACIEIPSKANNKMIIIPFFKKLYQCLWNNNNATTKELYEAILEPNFSAETRSFIEKKIENMASAKLNDDIAEKQIFAILESLSCQEQDCEAGNNAYSGAHNALDVDNADSAPIDFDMSWSADTKKESTPSPIPGAEDLPVPEEQVQEMKRNETYDYLSADGFLFPIVNMIDYEYTYVDDVQSQLSLKYELMANSDIAIEAVSISETTGLLFYICQCGYFYFVPQHRLNTKIVKSFLDAIIRDKQRYIYTMFSIPLLYTLFSIDLYPVENMISLYDLYNIANGNICKEPKNIIRTVSSDFSVALDKYIPYTMQYYCNVAKKYRHRYDKKKYMDYCHLLRRNHIFAMSYKLKKIGKKNSVYIQLNSQDASYKFLYTADITLEKTGKKISISYENPVSNHSRYLATFSAVIEKLYTTKAYKSYKFCILDYSDTSLKLFVGQQSLEVFLSLLHSLLIRIGQHYISDTPNVLITFLE